MPRRCRHPGLRRRGEPKNSKAVALKLNEIVAAIDGASNRLIDVEELSEGDLEVLHLHYRKLVRLAKRDHVLTRSHSVEEANVRHVRKLRKTKRRSTPGARA